MQRIAKTISLTLSGILIFFAAAWPLRADLLDGAMVAARNILPPAVYTQSTPLSVDACFRPMVQYGTGSTGLKTATLPTAASMPIGCLIRVKNGDVYTGDNTGRGVKLSGAFPSDLFVVLYPNQVFSIVNTSSGWQTAEPPGRWRMPQQVTFHVDLNGSNTNDGLASGSTNAFGTAQGAYNTIMQQSDTQNTTPIIAMATGQTHTSALSMAGVPTGTNLVQLSPDGNASFTWSNAANCISIADGAELDLRLNQYGSSGAVAFACNTGNSTANAAIYMHNQTVVLDLEGGPPIWNPGGANDSFLLCDGYCQYTIANGITQNGGTGLHLINMLAAGHGTVSGALAGTSGTLSGIFFAFGPGILASGYTSSGWATPGVSQFIANFAVITNGVTPQGGYGTLDSGNTGTACTANTSTNC